ncbi:cupin domain-containing protein [Actinomycetospora termitidis]|uniref:Cupin domain-containing protein n=1 Tax=Actinomycetospora termitidis TaxID=3053470 RepID=A0ABT7M9Z1_9PSEU|nr:cupin domain-containing protein [Actinomycetospora sp. Odt1-22]MDL5157477.1 cupin domain-containing protein [Actinomycetospora sp. Odt1-22]
MTETFPLMGARAVVLATADETHGAWEQFELRLGPGARSPRHTIAGDKLFHVVDGTVTVLVGEQERSVSDGPVFVPAGTAHCYRNDSGADARMVVTVTGRGQIDFLRGMSRLTADGPPDQAALAEHTAAHGVTLLPPSS